MDRLLGMLAVRTGGNAMHDSNTVGADAIGSALADAVRGTVALADAAADFPAGMDVYPKTLPPMRSDRETVLVGSAKSLPKQVDDRLRRAEALLGRARAEVRSPRTPTW